MFLMFLVLTIQGCDLLNCLHSSDRCELAGSESGRRRSVTFILSSSLGTAVKVIREMSRPQWLGMYQCVFVWLRAAREGK